MWEANASKSDSRGAWGEKEKQRTAHTIKSSDWRFQRIIAFVPGNNIYIHFSPRIKNKIEKKEPFQTSHFLANKEGVPRLS